MKMGTALITDEVSDRALKRGVSGHKHYEALTSRHRGVEEITLKHRPVLIEHGDHDRGIFAPLALVDRARVGEAQHGEVLFGVVDDAPVKVNDRALFVTRDDDACITVVDIFIVVVLELHHAVADA